MQQQRKQASNQASKTETPSSGSNQSLGSNSARQSKMNGQAGSNGLEYESSGNDPWISSIYTHRHKVRFDDTIDIWVDAVASGNVKWEYEWSKGHQENVKLGDNTTNIHVELPVADTKAGPGDTIGFRTEVYNDSGGSDEHYLEFEIEGEEITVWEVFFDAKSEDQFGDPSRIDPLIFDLNKDGQLDITGANQTGDGQVDGEGVLFDMDPSKQGSSGWKWSSPGHRPGYYEGGSNSRVPAIPNGQVVYDSGQTESTNKFGSGRWREDDSKGNAAKIYDADNNFIGEWRKDTWGRSHGGCIGQYYWERQGGGGEKRERTEWMKGTGDGFLVWDHNGNGIIDDNTEMMSEFDVEGNKVFQNGFEKLAHYFDKDEDGIIQGAELSELKFWVDDGDAKTEKGELQELSEHGIEQIFIPRSGELQSTAVSV